MRQCNRVFALISGVFLLHSPSFAQSTGSVAVANVTPSSLAFFAVEIGRSPPAQTITVSNTGDGQLRVTGTPVVGTAAADFMVFNTCRMPLGKGQRCTITVTFKPSASGIREAALNVETSDKNVSVKLTGSISTTAPKIALTPSTLTFGSVNVGNASTPQKLTLSNSGNADFSLGPIRASGEDGSDFQIKSDCESKLAAGKTCEVSISFNPRTPGQKSASLTIAGQAIGSPATSKFTGTGVGSKLVASTMRLAFAEQINGSQSAPQSVTLSNGGNSPLLFSKISITGVQGIHFSQTNTCNVNLAPGEKCAVNVIYKPTAEGPKVASLSISGNFGSVPAMITIFADGKKPMQGGLWRGSDPISNKPMLALIAENGVSQYLREDGLQYFGITRVEGTALDAMLSAANAESLQGSARIQGTIKQGSSISGKLTYTPKNGTVQTSNIALTFDALYNKTSGLDKVAGNFKNTVTGATININSSGALFSQDVTTGCVVNGAVAIIDTRFNAYSVRLSFTGCKASLANLNTTTAFGLLTVDDSGKTPRLVMGAQALRPGYAIAITADKF